MAISQTMRSGPLSHNLSVVIGEHRPWYGFGIAGRPELRARCAGVFKAGRKGLRVGQGGRWQVLCS